MTLSWNVLNFKYLRLIEGDRANRQCPLKIVNTSVGTQVNSGDGNRLEGQCCSCGEGQSNREKRGLKVLYRA